MDELAYYKEKTLKEVLYHSAKVVLLSVIFVFLFFVYLKMGNFVVLVVVISLLILLVPMFFISLFKTRKYVKDYYIIKDLYRYSNTLEIEVSDSKEEVDL